MAIYDNHGGSVSDQAVSTSSVVVELQPEVPSFLNGGIDLKRLLKDVAKQSKTAVEALVGLLGSKDEKTRLAAAKALLELQVTVAKEINADEVNRLIAEVKLTGASKALIPVEEDDRPLVDFTTIREVS